MHHWATHRPEVIRLIAQHLSRRTNGVGSGAFLLRRRIPGTCGKAVPSSTYSGRQESRALPRQRSRKNSANLASLRLGTLSANIEGLRKASELVTPLDARADPDISHTQSAIRRYGSSNAVMRGGS